MRRNKNIRPRQSRLIHGYEHVTRRWSDLGFVVAGGVAANKAIRAALEKVASDAGARLIAPPLRHCTDNAAMIALAGAERLAAGLVDGEAGDLGAGARPRWPLDEAAAKASPVYATGRRGAKA